MRAAACQLQTNQRIAKAPRRLQQSRSRRRAHVKPTRSAALSAPCSIAARSPNTTITDNALSFMNDYAAITVAGAFDGFDVLRTSVPAARCCLARTR
jgi:hypothetical protein